MQATPNLQNYIQINERYSYNREDSLGGGTYGKVFRGWDNIEKKHIAVKNIIPKTLMALGGQENRQIEIMEKLQHPNTLKLYLTKRSSEEGLLLCLELCEQGCLSSLLEKKRLTEAQVLGILGQLISGMTYINQLGYFHRDLKPDNLLITQKGCLKIADFGTAKKFEGGLKATFRKCTPLYSAPEVFLVDEYFKNGEVYNQKCDVFSTGYILYEMLTGELLNKDITTRDGLALFLKSNKKNGGFGFDHPAITPFWKELLRDMLDFNVESRLTFEGVQQRLEQHQPSNQARPERNFSVDQKALSARILESAKNKIESTERYNNYLLGLLKVFYRHQYHRSELVPKVFKLLMLYYSLGRYCNLAEIQLGQLHQPGSLEIDGQPLEKQMPRLGPSDKKKLHELVELKASSVNKSLEEVRLVLIRYVIPELRYILEAQNQSQERKVLAEFLDLKQLGKFCKEEYSMNTEYVSKFQECVRSVYKTRSETFILSDEDLQIYLTLLILVKKEIASPSSNRWPPSSSQMGRMGREQLLGEVLGRKAEMEL